MKARLLLLIFSLMTILVANGSAQEQPLMIFWDESSNCGKSNFPIEVGTVTCGRSRNEISSKALTFKHGYVNFSMTYWRFSNALRVLIQVTNEGESSIPVNVKLWNLSAFKSYESFKAGDKPLFMRSPGKPMVLFNKSDLESTITGSNSGLPTNAPLRRETTNRGVFDPSTGRTTVQSTSKIVPDTTGSPSGTSIVGKAGASALSWTEVQAKSIKIGEVSFATTRDAQFYLVSFDVNRTVYIYMVGKTKD